jgi:hypothetical protein
MWRSADAPLRRTGFAIGSAEMAFCGLNEDRFLRQFAGGNRGRAGGTGGAKMPCAGRAPGSNGMKRRLYYYVSMLLLAAGLLIWQAGTRAPRELQHDGRPLSAWLEEVGEGPEEQRARAVTAVLAMEPAVWDELVNVLAAQDSLLRRGIARLGGAWLFPQFSGRSADEQQGTATIAFLALGPSARPAVPGLVRLLGKPSARERAAEALSAIGIDAVPALTGALTNTNPEVRRAAAAALEKIHSHSGR